MAAAIKEAHKLSEAAAQVQISPHAAEYHYYKSFPSFKADVDEVQHSIRDVLLSCRAAVAPKSSRTEPSVDWEDPNEVREWVGCALDDCMEGVDAAIDRHRHSVRQQALLEEGAELAGPSSGVPPEVLPSQLGPVSNIGGAPKGLLRNMQAGRIRPQEAFGLPVDNSPQPFVHWAPHLAAALPSGPAAAPNPGDQSQHPFAAALNQLSYAPSHLDASEPCPPRSLEETPLVWVDSPEALAAMAAELQGEPHLAVDLEHHSYRSFQGFTCLMQLSSRTKDYIVDTLALRQQIGPALIRIFTDSSIVKVLHGADHDVLWLQRDFHLYLVNMFDTGQATRVLSYPSNSLAFLLEHFCGVKADKRFQLADWRARPLTPEMLEYARGDTHYLLYCYDRLKQELAGMNSQVPPSLLLPDASKAWHPAASTGSLALCTVLDRSRRLCLALYEKEQPPTVQSCEDMVHRWELSLTGLQRRVLFAAACWRDAVCRELDEGSGYVLPRSQLITLAQHMPEAAKDVLRLLGRSASEALRSRAAALAAAICAAKMEVHTATAAKEVAAAHRTDARAQTKGAGCPMGLPNGSSSSLAASGQAPEAPGGISAGMAAAQLCTRDCTGEAACGEHMEQQRSAGAAVVAATAALGPPLPVGAAPLVPKPIAPIKNKAGSRGLFGNVLKRPRVGEAAAGDRPAAIEVEVADTLVQAPAGALPPGAASLKHAIDGAGTPPQASLPGAQAVLAPAAATSGTAAMAERPLAQAVATSGTATEAECPAAPAAAAASGSKPAEKARKARGSMAGLLGPSRQLQTRPKHPSNLLAQLQGEHPAQAASLVSAGMGDGEGAGEQQLAAQLKATLALPFAVMAPVLAVEEGVGQGETGAGAAQKQQTLDGRRQQQQQQQQQWGDGVQPAPTARTQRSGSPSHGSMDYVPIPHDKGHEHLRQIDGQHGGDQGAGMDCGQVRQGISQIDLSRAGKDASKRQCIAEQHRKDQEITSEKSA